MTNSTDMELSEELLKRYYELNQQKLEIDKELKQIKKQIHNYLDETYGKEQKGEVKLGRYKAQRVIRSSVSYDDEKTVKKLKDLNLEEFIEVVKRPDTKKLEAAMELDLVDDNEFADCKKKKQSQAITVKELSL
ncbi:hypothetical protein [Alkalibacillus aidingensis]|uniref:hypothetical protein n=1 Tax=Alkalibacillus aidingensis TaxID=2747607 RepID=UPI00166140E5|nr:hypothetical protein [Alkalibacillus aidingensis]